MRFLLSLKLFEMNLDPIKFTLLSNQSTAKRKKNSQQKIPPNVIYSNLRVNTSRKYQNLSFL